MEAINTIRTMIDNMYTMDRETAAPVVDEHDVVFALEDDGTFYYHDHANMISRNGFKTINDAIADCIANLREESKQWAEKVELDFETLQIGWTEIKRESWDINRWNMTFTAAMDSVVNF